ncbi:prepilin peptidase [Nocardioides solisilvae]|uniref:prepilin peptidase n=1 Tax=Nocardioides solisilvae TaxID=1542435 RepID=UPI000D741B26|nr:A24 family peptidase [Nocardioides solisilvae]
MIGAALLGAGLCGAGGLLVPPLVARIPEPEPEPASEPEPVPASEAEPAPATDVEPASAPEAKESYAAIAAEAKESYAAIAATRGLGVKAALASGASGGVVGAVAGWDWSLLLLLPLVPVLVALAVVDWRTRLLPTWVIARCYAFLVPAALVAALVAGDHADLVRAAWGWLVAGTSFFLLWFVHPRGLGYGDVRLSGVLGIALGHLGWGELLTGLYAGFVLGGVVGGLLAATGRADRTGVPFGPFMVLGALVGVVAGPWVWGHLVGGWA